ncbi:hypothetical protein BGX21_000292 [Mortierella sp. AD011]|nr:hypothetical protein BGX20_005490 [Mortierella sp. AD010]KAF9388509.1 hypothetical protein BGX21_000292 [Mortierella sp. AD011]
MSFPTEPSNTSITGLMAGNHSRDENLADLDGPSHSRSVTDNSNNPQEPGEPKKLNLATLVDRVRQVQKSDPGSLQTPAQETHPAPQHPESPHHQHWYSNLMSHYQSSSSSAPPPKSLGTVGQAANMFTAAGRTDNNLVSIDSSVSSLAIVGASAPAFLFQRDDKGRRPLGIVDSEVNPHVSRQIIFRIELQYGDLKWVIRRSLYEFYKLHLTLSRHHSNLPRFPNQVSWAVSMAKAGLGWSTASDDDLVRETNRARRKALQDYLLKVLQELKGTVVYDLYEFLEISVLSLTKDMGWKGKEGHVETKVIDTSRTLCGIPIGFNEYTRSWAILRDSYLAFCPDMSVDECSDVFIFDQSFYVKHKENILGFNMHHIEIGDSRRKIEMKGEHNREMVEWMEFFHKMQQSSPWVKTHRYGSFAPEREDAKVRYYVDGKDYFHAVSDAILAAKDEIYIADWWLSPELYLRRPPEKNEDFRLDRLLQRKAQDGVKIYIVVYKEVSVALTLDSAHTKTWLQDLHPNIQGSGTIWPGQDYSNPRIRDFANVKDYNTDLIERKLLGRMPWHDVSIGVAGKPARDIARHFVQRWNFVKREKGMKKLHMKFLTPKGEFVSTRDESGWTGTQKVQLLRSSTTWSQGVDLEHSIQTAYLNNIENAEHFIYIENQFFVTLAAENGNPDLKNTIGIAIVNRIIRAHNEGKKFRVIVVMPLMPAFEADIMSSEAGTLRKVMHFQYVSICRGGNSIMERLEANGINPDQYIGFFGLRSFDRIKHGKFDAIVEAVKEAELEAAEQPAVTAPAQDVPQQSQSVQFEDQHDQPKNKDLLKVAAGGELGRKKSLATKFLLDPIPRDKEAERFKAISARRKARDHERTWDESITKRAMGMSKKEHGYVPATTEKSMSNKKLSEKIRQQTLQKEREARENQYQGGTTDNTEPHMVEGLGTNIRSAVEEAKGPKEHGGLDPPKDVVTPSATPTDSVRSGDAKVSILQKVKDLKNTIESVVEPSPPSSDGDAGSSKPKSDDGDADDKDENDVDDFVTEQLYIHSKLMIVDDRIIIIGSANINDRSQVGFRDSEIAIVIEDTDMVPSKMNGVEYKAGRLAHALRTDLFKEHLGLLPHVEHDVVTKASVLPVDLDAPTKDPEQARQELIAAAHEENQSAHNAHSRLRGHLQVFMPNEEEAKAFQQWHARLAQGQAKDDVAKDVKTADQIVMDPLHDDFYESWWKRVANQNTEIFREVFHCVPDQTVQSWDDYKAFVPDPKKVLTGHVAMPGATVENVTEKLQGVTGHLVEFPTKFLCKESLLGGVVDNAVTPMEIFT